MDRRTFLHHAGLAVAAVSGSRSAGAADEQPPKGLNDLLEQIRKDHQLPGLAAAVTSGGRVVAEGVAGVRRVGKDDKIALEDRFEIGSCTKRMTAAMIGRVIDAGKLTYETALADALPDVGMRDDYRRVTIGQLLTFTGGIQPYTRIGPRQTPILFELKGTPAERREQFVRHVLREEPVAKPGTRREYSNASYAVAAYAAAVRTGRGWEQLMEEEVFKPLGLTRAGFGRPRTKDRPNEPQLHVKEATGYVPEAEEGRPPADPDVILAGPGGVHCSIRDFAKFAAHESSAARGQDLLLKPATAKRWQEMSRDKQKEARPVRGGTPWLTAGYVLWAGRNRAAVVAVNGGAAFDACDAVFKAVEER